MAVGAVHELQVRAHGAQGAGCQHRELGLELLFELFEFGWGHEAEFAEGRNDGGWRVAAFVRVERRGDGVYIRDCFWRYNKLDSER